MSVSERTAARHMRTDAAAGTPPDDRIEAAEAYAFLRVLAPKLEHLRRRLVAANEHLDAADPDRGRLDAIVESQHAFKEFLSGVADLNALVAPIDLLLEALREEAAAHEQPPVDPANIEPPPAPLPAPAPAPARSKSDPSPVAWLRAGTAAAMGKLIAAGMSRVYAEGYVASTYASAGLTLKDGSPITNELIRQWSGAAGGTWRRTRALKRIPAGSPARNSQAQLAEAQARVDDLAAIFKRMAAAG